MSYEIALIDVLKAKSEKLYGRLLEIEEKARPLLSYTQCAFPYYTPHDFHHSKLVEENLNWIIPDDVKDSFNAHEIFLLIISAWMHDWGMVCTDAEDPETVRETHHIRTEEYFDSQYTKLGISEHEAIIAGRISKGHRKVDLYDDEFCDKSIEAGKCVRVRFLSALLRLADETDVTHSRTPEILYYTLNPSEKSEEEFKKHLSITGISKLREPHKIYLTALARDPKGAEAIRALSIKIQNELNAVKGILSQHNIPLDTVELQLETRGFVDKPIAFEIDRKNIVKLLIGEHLYSKKDVAIRELIQNSIDSCKTRLLVFKDKIIPEIYVDKNNKIISISDNGLGMGYREAKEFLSNIGNSYYKSDEFANKVKDVPYDPISSFGIGLLSSFLIANKMSIETKNKDEDACLFTVDSINQNWKYEKSSKTTCGTTITLELNEVGKKIDLIESLEYYFPKVDIPIKYKVNDSEYVSLDTNWSLEKMVQRYETDSFGTPKVKEVIDEYSDENYDIIFTKIEGYFSRNLTLLNHGIYVNNLGIDALQYPFHIILNVKKNIFDLHMSRENVIENEKWRDLITDVLGKIFKSIYEKDLSETKELYVKNIYNITRSHGITRILGKDDDFPKNSIRNQIFYNHIKFPVLINEKITFKTLQNIEKNKEILFYDCCDYNYCQESQLISKIDTRGKIVLINPYDSPSFIYENQRNKKINTLRYILDVNEIIYTEINLNTILLEMSEVLDIEYSSLNTKNIKFAKFGEFNPISVIVEPPQIIEKEMYLGSNYWGNILLFWELIDEDRREDYRNTLNKNIDRRYESLVLVKRHEVLLNASDKFIEILLKEILTADKELINQIEKYFIYISYFPLIIKNLESCIFILNVIDDLELSISKILGINKPKNIFDRMQPNTSLFINYYESIDLNSI